MVDRAHPVLDGVTLSGVIWSASEARELPGVPLISAGGRPLAVEQRDGEARRTVLDLDVERSTLTRSPDWPILLANAVEQRRRALPGPESTNVILGQPFRYRGRDGDGPLLLRGRDFERALPARRDVWFDAFPGAGAYELVRAEDDRVLCAIGVRFGDPAESNLATLGTAGVAATSAAPSSRPTSAASKSRCCWPRSRCCFSTGAG